MWQSVKILFMSASEEKIFPGIIAAWLAVLFILLAALTAPTASAKTLCTLPNRTGENSVPTVQLRFAQSPQTPDLQWENSIGRYDLALDDTLAAESTAAGANSAIQGENLARQLTSEEQMSQALSGEGKPIFGAGTSEPLDNADRLADQYGGHPEDWTKMRSKSSEVHGVQTPNGNKFETHWYQNIKTGQVVEIKTKITGH